MGGLRRCSGSCYVYLDTEDKTTTAFRNVGNRLAKGDALCPKILESWCLKRVMVKFRTRSCLRRRSVAAILPDGGNKTTAPVSPNGKRGSARSKNRRQIASLLFYRAGRRGDLSQQEMDRDVWRVQIGHGVGWNLIDIQDWQRLVFRSECVDTSIWHSVLF